MTTVSRVLIVGGGIGGLCLASALRDLGIAVDLVEIKKVWTVYGVGIIQQCNVIRAMSQLGLLDRYLAAGYPFEQVRIVDPALNTLAVLPGARLAGPDYPANMGVSRLALHDVLTTVSLEKGVSVRLGVTASSIIQDPDGVDVTFNDGTNGRYDLVVGADGIASKVRSMIFGEHHVPRYTGQAVWRYNFARRPEIDHLVVSNGVGLNAGLVPLSESLMYMYLTSEEPANRRFPEGSLHLEMQERLSGFSGLIGELRAEITDPREVVYRPIETIFVDGPWHRGRVVLIGDAAHATSPHLGQGAGMAIEDAVVLAQELGQADSTAAALAGFQTRRYVRCRYLCEASEEIGRAEVARMPDLDRPAIVKTMLMRTAEPI